jgi:hypothetical protein
VIGQVGFGKTEKSERENDRRVRIIIGAFWEMGPTK